MVNRGWIQNANTEPNKRRYCLISAHKAIRTGKSSQSIQNSRLKIEVKQINKLVSVDRRKETLVVWRD